MRVPTPAACSPDVAKVLTKTLDEAVAAASKDLAARKVALTREALANAVDSVRGAVMICYPMGLPEWDLVRQLLEDKEGDVGASVSSWAQVVMWPQPGSCSPADAPQEAARGTRSHAELVCRIKRVLAVPCEWVRICLRSTGTSTWTPSRPRCGLLASRWRRRRSSASTWAATKRPRSAPLADWVCFRAASGWAGSTPGMERQAEAAPAWRPFLIGCAALGGTRFA